MQPGVASGSTAEGRNGNEPAKTRRRNPARRAAADKSKDVRPEGPVVSSHGTVNFFPDLPPYKNPTTGILSRIPVSWVPYAQLMRIDRPAGFYAFYFPYLIGLAYAACLSRAVIEPIRLLSLAALLLPLNLLLRGAACAWNDNVDQEFDRRVRRCRHRPVARGAVSTAQTHVFTVVLSVLGYPLLAPLPTACTLHMGFALVLFLIYALLKRVTYYPQVFLGIPFAWAIFFCLAALGIDAFGETLPSALALCGANILWTTTYDTIYAHQDVVDDEKAGVKGMALRFRNKTKLLATLLAIGQVTLLAMTGYLGGLGKLYYVGTVGGVAAAMSIYIYKVDLSRPESCGAWFHDQFWMVGAATISGFLMEYILRLL